MPALLRSHLVAARAQARSTNSNLTVQVATVSMPPIHAGRVHVEEADLRTVSAEVMTASRSLNETHTSMFLALRDKALENQDKIIALQEKAISLEDKAILHKHKVRKQKRYIIHQDLKISRLNRKLDKVAARLALLEDLVKANIGDEEL